MHTIEDEKAIQEYENYIARKGIDRAIVDAYVEASNIILCGRKDREYGLSVSSRAKDILSQYVFNTTSGSLWDLEKYAFENKTWYEILDKNYEILLVEAQNMLVDSGFRYLEKKREPKERFYMPRRKQFLKMGLTQALQGMIDDLYDILLISLIPSTVSYT